MECISCEVEINTKWKHAIDINVCPFCGSNIMEEQLKNLLSSLGDIMSKLQDYPDQVNDWMLSNFNFIKTDSSKLIEFLPKEQKYLKKIEEEEDRTFTVKVKTDSGEQEVRVKKVQTEGKTNDFFKRAEVIRPNIDGFNSTTEKTEHLKKIALQIKQSGSTSIDYSDDSDEDSFITSGEVEDPNASSEMGSLFSNNEISSSLGELSSGDDNIPSVVLNMANRSKGHSGNNSADLFRLQQSRDRVENSRRNFESGANRGKGGFSRS